MSVARLARLIIGAFKEYPEYRAHAEDARIVVVPSGKYFGRYYQDIQKRVPSIANARKYLGWKPKVDLPTAIRRTLDYHLAHRDYQLA